ncbi:T9SS type A sorting domain-containing protein [Flavobacterium jejuense]|uniref:T9SS type A sorting domain-containing protein n=1 Tax=Flavobacterium jejuense TaxID=1544455 RepID=A0ABX0IL89_9FLAO|nr:T9SS type A sorting domain-containing protein [Flavobacterium jejuense]NHN24575.1 T9SS type A sorting domain-containing protein [Flavobacterium jejuense]
MMKIKLLTIKRRDRFMLSKIALIVCFSTISAQNYTSLTVTSGFNQDIIANGTGDSSLSTTMGLDQANTRALVSLDFQIFASSATPTYGLPVNGLINSAVTTGLTFQLADYNSNNALFLTPTYVNNGAPNTGTLSVNAQNISDIYILAAAAGGGEQNLPFTATLNFSDNSTQTAVLSVSDWYSGTNYAIQGIGRINTSNNNLEGDNANPRLYEISLALDSNNQSKTLTGISFLFEGNDSAQWASQIRMSVLGISVKTATLQAEDFNLETLTIYPNPTSEKLIINSTKTIKEVKIYNEVGQEVVTANSNEINISTIASGYYNISVKLENDKIVFSKFYKK